MWGNVQAEKNVMELYEMYKIKELFKKSGCLTSFLSALALSLRAILKMSAIRLHVYVITIEELAY